MREKIDFGRAAGLDCEIVDIKETGIDRKKFIVWLLTNHQPMGKDHSRNLAYCINKVLIDEGKTDLTIDESKTVASKLILSKLSKSNIRIKLIALEYYMEYIGKPIHFKKPQDTKRSPKYLTEAQMQKLIHASRNYRDAAMLMVFCTTGIRCGELRNLNLGDIEFGNDVLRIRHGKGDREREVYLTKECKGILNAYLQRWGITDPNGPLFCSYRNQRISNHAIGEMVRKTSIDAGLPLTSPHVLRHSYATCYASKNNDVFVLQELLGHSQIDMTKRYYHTSRALKQKGAMTGAPSLV